jgi:hypothetical protein
LVIFLGPSCSATLQFFQLPTREISGKLLDLFLVSNPDEIADFYQMNILWSDHDMIFLSCRRSLAVERCTRNFRSIEQSDLLCAATRLDWLLIQYLSTLDIKVERFYGLVQYLLDAFAPRRLTKCVDAGNLSSVKHWLSEDIVWALAERDGAHDVRHSNLNRVKGDRLWGVYAVKLDPDLPPRKLYNPIFNI